MDVTQEETEQWLLANKDKTVSQLLTDDEIIDFVQIQDPSDSEAET